MAGNPENQSLDPDSVPGPVTPADSPGDAAGFAMVTPHGRGTAPYDIAGPMEDMAGLAAAAQSLTGPGGPRQAASERLLGSPQGMAALDITDGWAGGPGESWPNDIFPD